MKPLSQRQKALVRRSFSRNVCCHQATSQYFLDRLFALDPEIEPLFPADLAPHKHKFMQMLALLINVLDEPERFSEMARKLGERHLRYGVRPRYYGLGREALLWALEQIMKDQFTPAVHEAWSAFYDALVTEALSTAEGK
jgi:hemoglobin-like flavoprotein